MSDEIPAVPLSALTPGTKTSEHAQISAAGILNYVGMAVASIMAVGPGLVGSSNPNSKWGIIGGAIIALAAIINKTMLALGYNYGRTMLKAQVSQAQTAQLVAQTAQPLQAPPMYPPSA